MTMALAGHARRNSTDCSTPAGTCVLSIGANANFGKNPCAVVVSRYTSGTPSEPASPNAASVSR